MPILGIIETPKAMPKSITDAVLGKGWRADADRRCGRA